MLVPASALVHRNLTRITFLFLSFVAFLFFFHLRSDPPTGTFFQSKLCRLYPGFREHYSECQPPSEHVAPEPFPHHIWQTYKKGAASVSKEDRDAIRSWEEKNPGWRYELFTDKAALEYVAEKFSDMPEVRDAFIEIGDPILRADMFRYMILYQEGGVYGDIDTQALKPVADWIPEEYRNKTNVVLGIEFDKLDGQRWLDWTIDLQLCNWVMLSKPGHDLWKGTIERAVSSLKTLAQAQNTTLKSVHPDYLQVLDSTGPAAMTRTAFEIFANVTASNFTWKNLTALEEPRLIGDILVLPVTAFAPGQVHSHSKPADDPEALVEHLWKGSWKGSHVLHTDNHRVKRRSASSRSRSSDP